MADIEKVISHLKDCFSATRQENVWAFVRKDMVADTVELLEKTDAVRKENEKLKFVILSMPNWLNETRPEVVRCKECKYGEPTKNALGEQMVRCEGEFTDWLRYPDWYCADGEKKEV